VKNLPLLSAENSLPEMVKVDVRDFQDSANKPIYGAINIPCGYLGRYMDEIPNKKIVIIASNQLEKNFGARFLRKYGFQVEGYTLIDS
jgi:rhodanese-related sulfurtransferase